MKKLTAILLVTIVAGCRGETSTQPPIHIVPNMDWQDKLKAQSESKRTLHFSPDRSRQSSVEIQW